MGAFRGVPSVQVYARWAGTVATNSRRWAAAIVEQCDVALLRRGRIPDPPPARSPRWHIAVHCRVSRRPGNRLRRSLDLALRTTWRRTTWGRIDRRQQGARVAKINQGRWTAEIEGNFVVFLIGARFEKLRGGGARGSRRSPRHEAHARLPRGPPRQGLAGVPVGAAHDRAVLALVRAPRSLRRTRDDPHLEAWRQFWKRVGTSGRTGIWHETYLVRAGEYEAIYGNMPPFGLGKASNLVRVSESVGARRRLKVSRPLTSSTVTAHGELRARGRMMMTTDSGDAGPIRTPDQRLRVFVSSTLAELAPERAAVARAISALRLTPVMFELGARPHPPRELYRAYLAQSDIFIGLYWQRYGWIGPGMDISGLEDEFRLSDAMPRLLYMKSPAPEQEPRLAAMIAELQSAGADSYRSFRSPRELGRLVRDDLALLLSERFATAAFGGGAFGRAGRRPRPGLPRRSLPTPSTSLIGREDDIAELSDAARVTRRAVGHPDRPGGIGKTRLAIAVGAALDGAGRRTVFVPLASITEPALVLPRVAAAVGAPIEGTRSALDALIEHFAPTPTLLVLDNLEQVTGAATDARPAARRVLRRHDPRHEPHRAATPRRAGVPGRAADGAGVRRTAAARRGRGAARGAAVRRPSPGGPPRLRAGRHERCRGRGDLPAPRRSAARDRARRGSHPSAPTRRAARPARTRPRRAGHGPVDLPERQRTLRATVEWSVGLLDDAGARARGGACRCSPTDGRSMPPTACRRPHGGRDARSARRARRPQPRQRRRERRRAPVPHARDGARARRRAARRWRRRCRRRAATRRVLRRARGGRQLARRTTGRMGRPAARRGGEPASRDPVVLRPTTSRRCLTCSACCGCSGRCATGCRRVARWIDELRLRADALDDHARAEVLFTCGRDGGRGRRRHERARRDRRHRAASTGRSTIRPGERAAAGGRVDAADPRRLRRRAARPRRPRSTASADATNRSSRSPS